VSDGRLGAYRGFREFLIDGRPLTNLPLHVVRTHSSSPSTLKPHICILLSSHSKSYFNTLLPFTSNSLRYSASEENYRLIQNRKALRHVCKSPQPDFIQSHLNPRRHLTVSPAKIFSDHSRLPPLQVSQAKCFIHLLLFSCLPDALRPYNAVRFSYVIIFCEECNIMELFSFQFCQVLVVSSHIGPTTLFLPEFLRPMFFPGMR
jgi:hypothetical protein